MLVSKHYLSYYLCVLQIGKETECCSDFCEAVNEVRHTDEPSVQEIMLFATHSHKVTHFTNKEIVKSETNLSAKY